MFLQLKSFLEKIDYHRDNLLFPSIKRFWPRYILPNHLTILRIVLALLIICLLIIGVHDRLLLALVFIVGALLDLFDGSVARALKKETRAGAILDTIADKILVLPIVVFILFKTYVGLLLFLMIPEIISGLMTLYYRTKRKIVAVNIFGKTKMVIACVALSVIIIFDFPDNPSNFPIILLFTAAIFACLSVVLNLIIVKTKNT